MAWSGCEEELWPDWFESAERALGRSITAGAEVDSLYALYLAGYGPSAAAAALPYVKGPTGLEPIAAPLRRAIETMPQPDNVVQLRSVLEPPKAWRGQDQRRPRDTAAWWVVPLVMGLAIVCLLVWVVYFAPRPS